MASGMPKSSERTEATARALLRPVLKLLFRRGLSRQTLESLCDEAYVEAAAEKLGQTADVSLKGVAQLSGLSITKVRRLKDVVYRQAKTRAEPFSEQAPLVHAATRVMTGWYSDTAFTDKQGQPLPFRSDSPSFKKLVRKYGNGFTTGAVAGLLLSTESVKLNERGEFKPQGRHVLAAPHSDELDHNALGAFIDLAQAVEINQRKLLTHAGALQRTCHNDRMPKRVVPLFKAMIRQHTQSFLETIDDWLVQHEATDDSNAGTDPLVRLGVGVYGITDEPAAEDSAHRDRNST